MNDVWMRKSYTDDDLEDTDRTRPNLPTIKDENLVDDSTATSLPTVRSLNIPDDAWERAELRNILETLDDVNPALRAAIDGIIACYLGEECNIEYVGKIISNIDHVRAGLVLCVGGKNATIVMDYLNTIIPKIQAKRGEG